MASTKPHARQGAGHRPGQARVPRAKRLLVLMVLLFATHARAAEQEGRSAAARRQAHRGQLERAKGHFRRAQLHYRRGNFALALESFKEAMKYARRPSIILNVAQCYRQLGDASRAALYYRLYLSEWEVAHPGTPPKFEAEVRRHIEALSEKNRARERAKRRAVTSRPANQPQQPALDVTLNQRIVPAELEPKAPAERETGAGSAELVVFASPDGSAVLVDGELAGLLSGGELALALAPGQHELRVTASGHTSWQGKVTLRAGGEHRLEVDLERAPPGPSMGWFVTAIATTTIALAAEITALVYTSKANNEFKQSRDFKRFRDGAIAGHIVAGSVALTSAVSWLLYYRSIPSAKAPRARFALMPLSGGAYAAGGFSF
jgi:tetratricopeptide (TPR) repeat protein